MGAGLWVYNFAMEASPHYLVDQTGRIEAINPIDLSAWHTGSSQWRRYRNKWQWGPKGKYSKAWAWWTARFPGLASPLELPPWRNKSPNARTIGVEVIPPEGHPTRAWSPEVWRALKVIHTMCTDRVGDLLPWYTHSELAPIGRTRPSGLPWDPHIPQWSRGTPELETLLVAVPEIEETRQFVELSVPRIGVNR